MVLLLIWPLSLWAVVKDRPPWGDEVHFLSTVRIFGAGPSVDLLRAYPEMSGPLTFLVYSAWGHLVGFSTPALRLLSPLIAAVVSVLWLSVLRRHISSSIVMVVALGSIVLNPYFVGLSVLVFTDMLALLGLALTALGIQVTRPSMVAVGIAIGTCSRQYLAFLVPAVILAERLMQPRDFSTWRFTFAALLGLVPLSLLILLWDGHLTPANGIRETYLSEGFRYDPHALSLYLAAPGAYLLLLVAPVAWKAGPRLWALALLSATIVWLAPVQASIAQTREGVFAVGFVHRAAVALLPPFFVNVLFMVLAALAIVALLKAGMGTIRQRAVAGLSLSDLFFWMATLSFLLVMPFSYLPWEKYALPLFMVMSPLIAREMCGKSGQSRRVLMKS